MRYPRFALSAACLTLFSAFTAVVAADKPAASEKPAPAEAPVTDLESKHLSNLRQVTTGFPRAGEGYFSPDGESIVFQAYPIGYPFYQIYTQKLDGTDVRLISPGRGKTTCSYFSRDGKRLLFASSHSDPDVGLTERKFREEAAKGGRRRYQWDFDQYMDIYECNLDGSDLKRLTDAPGYDAEGSYSHDGNKIVFTSSRDGDPDLYIMDADGKNVVQLTNVDGYDGGPFFSPDDKWVIFRSDREEKDMLQIRAISVDGKHDIRLTDDLKTVNWAPYFHPSGKYLIWTRADYSKGPQSAGFDLFAMDIETTDTTFKGSNVEQITSHKGTDILPVFSPDGKKLMWTSTRSADGSSQLWIADWKK